MQSNRGRENDTSDTREKEGLESDVSSKKKPRESENSGSGVQKNRKVLSGEKVISEVILPEEILSTDGGVYENFTSGTQAPLPVSLLQLPNTFSKENEFTEMMEEEKRTGTFSSGIPSAAYSYSNSHTLLFKSHPTDSSSGKEIENSKPVPASLPLGVSRDLEEKKAAKIFDLLLMYEIFLTSMGYRQLIHKPVLKDDPILKVKNVGPTNEKEVEVNGIATKAEAYSHNPSALLSARLYAKDDSFYVLYLKVFSNAVESELNEEKISENLTNPHYFKSYPDGACTVLVALIRNQDGILEQQLRIIPGTTTGHPGLVFKSEGNQPPCAIAAGEAYLLNGKILLINNKSGRFHELLRNKNIDQKAVFDSMLKDYYADEYKDNCFVPATANDQEIIYKVLERGFPHSLLAPASVRDKFPISSLLPPEFRAKVQKTDELYKNQKQEKLVLEKNKQKSLSEATKFVPGSVGQSFATNSIISHSPSLIFTENKQVDSTEQDVLNKDKQQQLGSDYQNT